METKTIPLKKVQSSFPSETRARKNVAWNEASHLFDQTGESVFIIGMDLRYITANQQALELLGYTRDEMIGMSVSAVVLLGEDNDSVLKDGNIAERTLKRKDGSTLPVEISASIIYDEKKEPVYIQSIARDISERKRAELSAIKHSRILSAINNATARLLRSPNIEMIMPEILASLGEAIDVSCCAIFEINTFTSKPVVTVQYQWMKANCSSINIPTSIHPFIPAIIKISGSQFFNTEEWANGASCIIIPIHGTLDSWGFLGLFDRLITSAWSSSERDAAEMAAGLIGSALQRSSYEETIRINENRNQIILSVLPDLLIRLDAKGVILDYMTNPGHPLYLQRDMISGKKLSEIWPEETVRNITGVRENPQNELTKTATLFTLPFSASDYESRLYPISETEVLLVIRDITEQTRLDRMKTDFINRASHELRTPLTTVILMADLIQDGGSPDELNQYWRTMMSELNRQKILIDRLLTAGRLENGMIDLEKTPLDLMSILEESILAMKPIAVKRSISIELFAPKTDLYIIGDKSGIQQVFINLINNAVKFSPKGSVINVEVKPAGDRTHISIIDRGLGIPAEAIPHLFERFYRAKNVTLAEIPGSGIGLYIVKSIVEALGGNIEVESVQNKGTKFTITLRNAP